MATSKHSKGQEQSGKSGQKESQEKSSRGEGRQATAQKAHEEHGRGGERSQQKIDLNKAREEDLEQLTMMGPQRAKALVDHRPFKSWEDVEKVPGFSTGMIEDLKESGATIGAERE